LYSTIFDLLRRVQRRIFSKLHSDQIFQLMSATSIADGKHIFHVHPKFINMGLRFRHYPVHKDLHLLMIFLPDRIIFELTPSIPENIELRLIRPIKRWNRVSYFVTYVRLLF
jgi:hypothetical protein